MGHGFDTPHGPVQLYFSRHLDTVGDGSGTKNFNGDYTVASGSSAEIAFIQPADGVIFRISRLIVTIEDTKGMKGELYGTGAALNNGIQVRVQDDSGTVIDLTDGVKIKTNTAWGHRSFDIDVKAWGSGAGDETLLCRWSFDRAGVPLRLDGSDNERLEVTFTNDQFNVLKGHFFIVQGYQERDWT